MYIIEKLKDLFCILNNDKSAKKEILDDLKFLTTTQILLVVIISILGELPSSGLTAVDSINYTFPIAFLFLSILLLKFNHKEEISLVGHLIKLYLLSFGIFIISLYFMVNLELMKYFSMFITPLYFLFLLLIYFIPSVIFMILLLSKK